MKNIKTIIIKSFSLWEFIKDSFMSFFLKRAMGSCGNSVMLKPSSSIFKGIENFHFSNDIRIARNAMIYSTNAKLFIGPKVGIAPYLKIVTGNHRVDEVGVFMFDSKSEKRSEDDKDVILEGDLWIGAGVTILSGVRIGRGSVIAAGSVVNKSFPPYSIIGGVPAKILRYRFSVEEIINHERELYPQELRISQEELINNRENTKK